MARAAHECLGSHFLTVSCVTLYYGHTICFTYIFLLYTWDNLSYTWRESFHALYKSCNPLCGLRERVRADD
jgi:hypothetical protein